MVEKAYHLPHETEANKTVCGRPIEVNGRPQVLLTTNADKKKGTVCGRCKALKAGQARTEKITAKHRKIREAAAGAHRPRGADAQRAPGHLQGEGVPGRGEPGRHDSGGGP